MFVIFCPQSLGECSNVHWLGTAVAKPLLYFLKKELFANICLVCVQIFTQIEQRLTVKSLSYQQPPSDFKVLIMLNWDKNQPLTVTSLLVLSKKWSLLTNCQ